MSGSRYFQLANANGIHHTLPGGGTTSYVIHAGRYKTRPNSVITRYGDRFEYASPEETPALMADLVDWYNEAETSGEYSPVELAALFHYRYIRIHPFEDGNGRIARLLSNYILARQHPEQPGNVSPAIIKSFAPAFHLINPGKSVLTFLIRKNTNKPLCEFTQIPANRFLPRNLENTISGCPDVI